MTYKLPVIPRLLQEFLAEFIGSFILMFMGYSGILLINIFPTVVTNVYTDCGPDLTCQPGSGRTSGEAVFRINVSNVYILVIALAFGGGLVGAIMVVGHITGAHLNPSLSLTLATMSKLPYKKLAFRMI